MVTDDPDEEGKTVRQGTGCKNSLGVVERVGCKGLNMEFDLNRFII